MRLRVVVWVAPPPLGGLPPILRRRLLVLDCSATWSFSEAMRKTVFGEE